MTAVEQHDTVSEPSFRVLDTSKIEWVPEINLKGFLRRLLYEDPDTGSSTHIWQIPPGWGVHSMSGKPGRHIHRTVRERSIILEGEQPRWEYSHPRQIEGTFGMDQRWSFQDRPPRCLHGLEPGPTSKTGAKILFWDTGISRDRKVWGEEEEKETLVIPYEGDLEKYGEDFAPGTHTDTYGLPWQPHPVVSGWKRKVLSERTPDAPPAYLVHVPTDWDTGAAPVRLAAQEERHWLYVINGDLPLTVYADGSDPRETVHLKEGFYLELRGAASIGFNKRQSPEIGATIVCMGHQLA